MELVDSAQHWEFEEDKLPAFLHTTVICQHDGNYYMAQVKERQPALDAESLNTIAPQMIPPEHLWPRLQEGLTVCEQHDSHDIYIKRPSLTSYDGSDRLARLIIQEARVCEILMQKPHPNIVTYRGCYVQGDRIEGLCFQRYAETAEERKKRGHPINKTLVLDMINAAITHLHSINLNHNDIKAANIMFPTETSEEAILVDFDSCTSSNAERPEKRGFEDAFGMEELAKFLE